MRFAIGTLCSLLAFPGLAAPSGVLLGLRDDSNAYRTIWIVTQGGAPAVAAVVKGLVVPRAEGFWRLDVEHITCGESGQYLVDELRLGPLDSGTAAPITRDCQAIAEASCGAVYPAGGGLVLDRWISYAGPTHFAEAFRLVESCGIHPVGETGYSVHAIDHPEQDVPMRTAFVADRMDALQRAAREALICETDDLDCIDSRDRYRVAPSSGWGIVRAAGQWSVVVSLVPPAPSRVAPSPVVTGFPAPAAILGFPEGKEDARVKEELAAGDPFMSPEGDMVVVRSEQVAAYRLVGGAVDGLPTRVPTSSGERVVMIEWAAGPRVALWDAVLRGLPDGTGPPNER